MKKNYLLKYNIFKIREVLFLTFIISFSFAYSQTINPWLKTSTNNTKNILKNRAQFSNDYEVYSLDISTLKNALLNSPKKGQNAQKSVLIIEFPNSEGKFERFSVFETSIMHPNLQEKYPNIRSYTGKGIDDPSATIRFSISQLGLKTMTLAAGKNAEFIEPFSDDYKQYMVYNKQSKGTLLNSFECFVKDDVSTKIKSTKNTVARPNADDGTLRTYKLAISATGEYTQYFGGTKANALAAINATMTRVNGIFEIDFGVTMELIATNDAVIYTDANSDPYTNNLNNELQSTLTNIIGETNYDIGHLFQNAGNNGNAGCIGCVCEDNQKGSGFTSHSTPEGDNFDVDYVAHEMGHQFGGNHTWTFNGNEGTNAQMEPGSGSTIMGYAGITGSTDVQAHSDAYFHAISIQQVTNYVKTTSCQTNTPTGNSVPTALAGDNFTIPKSTPFLLTGDGTDPDENSLSYCWEQMDENNASSTYPNISSTTGVAFRSFSPSNLKTRSFPELSTVLAGNTSTQWEALPNVARILNFRLTVRDNASGGGANNSDDMIVTIDESAGPFVVSFPNSSITWNVGQLQTITWEVAKTNNGTVNCQTVNILLSTDGGNSYPISLASGVANNGSKQITVPNNIGTQNRIKIEAADNIFYDVSNTNFSIEEEIPCNATIPTDLISSNENTTGTTLTWNSVSGATFVIQYREFGTSNWISQSTGATTINLIDLNASTSYEAQIQSVCSNESSAFSASINFSTLEQILTYCTSNGKSTTYDYIDQVQLNSINNISGAGTGYSDFTSISTNLIIGELNNISITPVWTGAIKKEGYAVWIDYNKDGDFEDSGEQVWTEEPTKNSPVTGSFTVPNTASTGATTMRVSMKRYGIPTTCQTFNYGEVEDYMVNIISAAPDTQPPTAPVLTTTNQTESTIRLSWIGATDNVAVDGYEIYQNENLIYILTADITALIVTNLTADTTYNFTAKAIDAAGNLSDASNIVTATTTAPDTQDPTAPVLSATNETDTTVDLSWNGATDNVAVTGYDIYQNENLLTSITTTSYQVTGLTASTTYSFTIKSKDAAGNTSLDSNTATITTLEEQTSSTIILNEGYFESGWDGWIDGGIDVVRYNRGTYSWEGNSSILIRDNSGAASAMTLSKIDVSSFNLISIEFYFYARSMENGEDFWVRFYDGSGWNTVATYAQGTSFNNNNYYTATITLDSNNFNFPSNAKFRFQCDGSDNSDKIYIDQVTISGIIGAGTTRKVDGIQFLKTIIAQEEKEFEYELDDFIVYPNPVKGNYLNIKMNNNTNATFKISNVLGQILNSGKVNGEINVSNLNTGVYIIEVNDGEEIMTKKFVKQ